MWGYKDKLGGYVDLRLEGVRVYTDGRNKVKLVEAASGFTEFRFVFHNEELVSFGGVAQDSKRFYINHFGKEVKGRFVRGERFSVKKRGSEWEIEVKKDVPLWFVYTPFGKKLTPYIKGARSNLNFVILPELDKVYRGSDAYVVDQLGCLKVGHLSDKFRAYLIMPDGREYLVYEGLRSDFCKRYLPEFYRLGNVIIVKLKDVDQDFKKYFVQSPEFSYLFIQFYQNKDGEKRAKISFDLDNWVEVKASEMVFKEDENLWIDRGIKEEKEHRISERNVDDIRKAVEKIRSYIIRESEVELSPSLGG